MGEQNSCKILIGVHSTMHLMHPIKVLQLLHTNTTKVRPNTKRAGAHSAD